MTSNVSYQTSKDNLYKYKKHTTCNKAEPRTAKTIFNIRKQNSDHVCRGVVFKIKVRVKRFYLLLLIIQQIVIL